MEKVITEGSGSGDSEGRSGTLITIPNTRYVLGNDVRFPFRLMMIAFPVIYQRFHRQQLHGVSHATMLSNRNVAMLLLLVRDVDDIRGRRAREAESCFLRNASQVAKVEHSRAHGSSWALLLRRQVPGKRIWIRSICRYYESIFGMLAR